MATSILDTAARAAHAGSLRQPCPVPRLLDRSAQRRLPPAPHPLPLAPQYTRAERVQQLSPFEIDVLGPLFRNVGDKIRHKVEDNFWDVAPAFLFFGTLVYAVKQLRQKMLRDHRD